MTGVALMRDMDHLCRHFQIYCGFGNEFTGICRLLLQEVITVGTRYIQQQCRNTCRPERVFMLDIKLLQHIPI